MIEDGYGFGSRSLPDGPALGVRAETPATGGVRR